MSGAAVFWALLGGLGAVMAVLVVCRGHWYVLIDVMHRCPAPLLERLGWPTAHPFDAPGPAEAGTARRFPVRRLRARVLLLGLPQAALCPPAARRHARAFRLWAFLLLAGLAGAGAALISPVVLIPLAVLAVLAQIVVPRWPTAAAATA